MRTNWLPLLMLALAVPLAQAEEQAAAAAPLPAAPLEDAIKLAKSGVSEEVQVAWAETREAFAPVSADGILKLKEAGISEKVIAAFVRQGGARSAGEQAPYVRVVQRYDTGTGTRTVAQAVQQARQQYTREDAVQYTYAQPERVVYVDRSYSYPSTYYYGSYYSYPYHGWYYPRTYWHGGWGGHWHGHWGHGHWHRNRHCR